MTLADPQRHRHAATVAFYGLLVACALAGGLAAVNALDTIIRTIVKEP